MSADEAVLVSAIFTLLGIQLLDLIIIIAIATTLTIFLWLPTTFYVVNSLGRYRTLLKKDKRDDESNVGEYFTEKFKLVCKANFFIAFSLFITLIYLFNTLPSIFVEPPNMLQPRFSTSDIAFLLTLFIIPALLLSLRLLANPWEGLKFFNFTNISATDVTNKVRFFKEQIISLYFGFIATTIAIFYLAICFTAMKYNLSALLNVFLSFYPKNLDNFSIIFDIAVEIISILLITLIGGKIFRTFCSDR